MKYILHIVLVAILFACKSGDQAVEMSELFEKELIPMEQIVDLDTSQDTVIQLESGASFFVPKSTFVDAQGNTPASVTMTFKECFTLESMIGDDLTTTSGSELLVSNGMIQIEATSDGHQLEIGEGKFIRGGFPKSEDREDYDLFYGERDTVSGKMEWEQSLPSERENALIEKSYIHKVYCTGYVVRYGNDFVPTYRFEDSNISYDFFEYIEEYFKPSEKAMQWFVENHTLDYMSSEKRGLEVEVSFYRVDSSVDEITIKSSVSPFTRELRQFLKDMPPLDLSTIMNVNYGYNFPEISLKLYASSSLDMEDYQRKFNALNPNEINERDKDLYVYTITQLGWINCDRFYIYEDNTNLIVDSKLEGEASYFLMFKSINSLLKPTRIDISSIRFDSIPSNEDVMLVGYSFVDDEVKFSKTEFNTSNSTPQMTDPVGLSLETFTEEIKVLK